MTCEGPNSLTLAPVDLWNNSSDLQKHIKRIAGHLFRTSLACPGFAIADLGDQLDPSRFRSILIGFTAALDEAYQLNFARRLLLRSVGRFDQKVSTEAHLDGAPDESILMLGYEPTEIKSQLFVIDYSKCAADRGLDPQAFLDRFNPTFGDGRALLEPYTTEVRPFDSCHHRIVLINNSSHPADEPNHGMLGILHKSTVLGAMPGGARFINTLLMSPAERNADDLISLAEIRGYIQAGAFAARAD